MLLLLCTTLFELISSRVTMQGPVRDDVLHEPHKVSLVEQDGALLANTIPGSQSESSPDLAFLVGADAAGSSSLPVRIVSSEPLLVGLLGCLDEFTILLLHF